MPKRLSLLLLFSLLIVTTFPGSPRARTAAVIDFAELERVALEEMKEKATPGAAVAIIKDDRVIFSKGFGISNVETGAPVTTDMLFRIGSTTKMFTAAALLRLSEEGKLKLDQPISNYVRGLDTKVGALNLHQLLSHTAGLRDEGAGDGPLEDEALGVRVRAWKEDVFFTKPGAIYSYSSPGYWLAGFVTEEVSRRPYAEAMKELLFEPLGMKRTTFRPTVAMTYTLSQGHVIGADGKAAVVRPHPENAAARPGGSIFSSVKELSRFVIALMNEGRLEGKQVLPPSTLKTLTGAHARIPLGEASYGYGLVLYDERGVRVASHGGARRGYGSQILMVPAERFAVIILANRTAEMLNRTAEKAMEMLLPLKPKTAEKERPPVQMSTDEMSRYTGVFKNPPQQWEIFVREGKLFLKQEDAVMPLTKTGDYRFTIGEPGAGELLLIADAGGRVEYLFTDLYAARKVK